MGSSVGLSVEMYFYGPSEGLAFTSISKYLLWATMNCCDLLRAFPRPDHSLSRANSPLPVPSGSPAGASEPACPCPCHPAPPKSHERLYRRVPEPWEYTFFRVGRHPRRRRPSHHPGVGPRWTVRWTMRTYAAGPRSTSTACPIRSTVVPRRRQRCGQSPTPTAWLLLRVCASGGGAPREGSWTSSRRAIAQLLRDRWATFMATRSPAHAAIIGQHSRCSCFATRSSATRRKNTSPTCFSASPRGARSTPCGAWTATVWTSSWLRRRSPAWGGRGLQPSTRTG